MREITVFFLFIVLILSCNKSVNKNIDEQEPVAKYVNSFTKTWFHDHIYSGIIVFNMMLQVRLNWNLTNTNRN
tara:strand:+ start:6262 stop:6480 length:219 start_codon:yes stop_codon:yes gene_type:complete